MFPLIFALNMLVNRERGGVYTLKGYSWWLTEAGFRSVETVDIELHSPVIVAPK